MDMISIRRKLMASGGGSTAIIATATGNPLSFVTDMVRPLKSLVIPFTPIQEGTGDPSPDNVRPISGWTGATIQFTDKSLQSVSNVSTAYSVGTSSTVLTKDTTTNSIRCATTVSGAWQGFRINSLNLLAGHTYVIDFDISYSAGAWNFGFRKSNSTFVGSSDGKFVRLFNGVEPQGAISNQSGHCIILFTPKNNISVTVDGLVTSSAAANRGDSTFSNIWVHEASSIPITFTDPSTGDPLTVYGGTITLNEDGSADLVARQALWVEDGRRQPTRAIWQTSGEGDLYNRTLFGRLPRPQHDYGGGYSKYFSSDNRKFTPDINDGEWKNKFCFAAYRAAGYSFAYSIPKNISTKAEVAAYFAENPTTVVYPLETPITYHFDNVGQLITFIGTNTIWTDTNGTNTATYLKHQS